MASLETFHALTLPRLPACPIPLLNQHLVLAARDFCARTHAVIAVTDPVVLTAGRGVYDVDLPAETEVAFLSRVWVNTRQLMTPPAGQIDTPLAYGPVGSEAQALGEPASAYLVSPTEIALYPVPDDVVPRALAIRMAVQPMIGATTLPDVLAYRWMEAICAKAASSLALIPQQPFTNPELAMERSGAYEVIVNRAKLEHFRGAAMHNQSVRMRPFA
jgi:hypothetical protein